MKIIIAIRISKSQLEFGQILERIVSELGYETKLLNLDASDNKLFVQQCIRAEKAQLLMTVDCTGFDLRLLGDDLFYNSLCIPAMHFITEKANEKYEELSMRMNFDMGFHCLNKCDEEYIKENIKSIREVKTVEGFDVLLGIDFGKNIEVLYKYIRDEINEIFI